MPTYHNLNQGVHFINNAIAYLIEHFLLWHTSSTTHYPQWLGRIHKQGHQHIVDQIGQ